MSFPIRVQELRKPSEKPEPDQITNDNILEETKCKEAAFKWTEGEGCRFEDKVGKQYRGCVVWRFRNNQGFPLYVVESLDKTVRITVGEEKLSELDSEPCMREANATVEETNDQEVSRSPVASEPEEDAETGFDIGQSVVAWMDEDRSWKSGVILNWKHLGNIFIIKLDSGGFAGVSPSHLKRSPGNTNKVLSSLIF